MSKPVCLLVDGSNLFYRISWVFKDLTNSEGVHTGAAYGLLKQILFYKENFDLKKIVIFWDCPTTEKQKKDGYKANRKPSEFKDFVYQQADFCSDLMRALGIDQIRHQEYEADYLIAQYTRDFDEDMFYILSKDADMLQLVEDEKINVVTPGKASFSFSFSVWNESDVLDKYGVPPKKVPIYRAIIGDSSDNLPGAKRIPRDPLRWMINRDEVIDITSFYRYLGARGFSREALRKIKDHRSQAELNFTYMNLYKTWDVMWSMVTDHGAWNEIELKELLTKYEIGSMLDLPLRDTFLISDLP